MSLMFPGHARELAFPLWLPLSASPDRQKRQKVAAKKDSYAQTDEGKPLGEKWKVAESAFSGSAFQSP